MPITVIITSFMEVLEFENKTQVPYMEDNFKPYNLFLVRKGPMISTVIPNMLCVKIKVQNRVGMKEFSSREITALHEIN